MTASDRISSAWTIAAADLGFTFVAPFELDDAGRKVHYAGLVPDFGSQSSMLLFASEAWQTEPWASVAKKQGYTYACLTQHYGDYDRARFIATLNDWGWMPKDRPPPAWYTGEPWTPPATVTPAAETTGAERSGNAK